MKTFFSKGLQQLWHKKGYALWLLIPLSWLFTLVAALRRRLYQRGVLTQTRFKIPVIVVGNLSLGGSGKTPLVIYIAQMLQTRGLRVGIISRGYKGSHQRPTLVKTQSDPALVGDEPYLIYQCLQCPVVVGKDRVAALQSLLENNTVDVVLSDDGLQHYALARSIEIVVMPAELANTYCLPAGPLREPLSRLKAVDLIVYNTPQVLQDIKDPRSYNMHYQPDLLYKAADPTQRQALETFKGMQVHAVAGLGNPTRFFSMLQAAGLAIIPHVYPDHHAYKASDILFKDSFPVILTAKDFVKCTSFVQNQHWVLPIHAVLSEGFDQALWTLIQTKRQQMQL
ncbi:MAG: tetraacyldisaccharide 4'-kinase [Gammaproteobacteria bacterium]|nr:tetraacyldisaccharide 4'-kinase [Gammaproteobacteria bacterium]MBP9729567.1 tetraacyldisaccharide 4'-kinase [Gammaproteobacteria bacterium]